MESSKQTLGVVLLASKKTYSFAKKKPIVEWKTTQYDNSGVGLKYPHDFEIRLVKAATAGKSLSQEFTELNLDWNASHDIKAAAKKLIGYNNGLTDIVLYIENLGLAIIVESHSSKSSIIEVDSLDALKKAIN